VIGARSVEHVRRLGAGRVPWPVVGVLIGVFLIGWGGWAIRAATESSGDVTVKRLIAGRISLLDQPGGAGCITPRGSAQDICGVFYVDPHAPLHSGEFIRVALEHARLGDTSFDLMVVYAPVAH
jgi:hypothetical protein